MKLMIPPQTKISISFAFSSILLVVTGIITNQLVSPIFLSQAQNKLNSNEMLLSSASEKRLSQLNDINKLNKTSSALISINQTELAKLYLNRALYINPENRDALLLSQKLYNTENSMLNTIDPLIKYSPTTIK